MRVSKSKAFFSLWWKDFSGNIKIFLTQSSIYSLKTPSLYFSKEEKGVLFTFSIITLAEIICVINSTSLIALLMSLVPSKLLLFAAGIWKPKFQRYQTSTLNLTAEGGFSLRCVTAFKRNNKNGHRWSWY